ncbi:MAG: alpha/beta fold hydrolase [Leptospiraceae bacterium]|nr:alpha/beta fold hydrolase [Leptospiraceae bacterium]
MSRIRPVLLFLFVDLLVLALAGVTYFFSSLIVAFDVKTLEQDRENLNIESPANFGLPQPENVRIPVGDDNQEMAGWLFIHPNPALNERACVIISHHGHTGTRYGGLKYIPPFWTRGCHALAVDGMHHGESDGAYGTFGCLEKDNMRRVVTWLVDRLGLQSGAQVGLIGESMGAAIALQTAAVQPEIAFVVADSSFSELDTILSYQGEKRYGFIVDVLLQPSILLAGIRSGCNLYDVQPAAYAARIRAPVLLIHSAADEYTPPAHSEKIFANIKHEAKVLRLTDWGASHGRSIDTNQAAYRVLLYDFLDRYVPEYGNPVGF